MPETAARPWHAWGLDGMLIGLEAGLGCAFFLGEPVRTWDARGSALERGSWGEALLAYTGGLGVAGFAAGAMRRRRMIGGAAGGWAAFMVYALGRLPAATLDDMLWWLGRWASFGLLAGAMVGGVTGVVFLFVDERTGRFRFGWREGEP